jgi:hypothetical protein
MDVGFFRILEVFHSSQVRNKKYKAFYARQI